jgi:hypothetical protein
MNKPPAVVETLQWLLALLRAQYWMYQNLHWEVQGDAAYGNHLLFQRIYEGDDAEGEDDDGVQGEVDALAEKMVGTYGNAAVSSAALIDKVNRWLHTWDQVDCLFRRALYSERCARICIRRTYERLKDLGAISLGMDDFLMGLDSGHETNEYLLRQVLRAKESAERTAADWAALRKGT